MKKIYLLAGALIGTLAVNAQVMSTKESAKNDRNEIKPTAKKVGSTAKTEGDVLWTNDFSTTTDWAQTTGTGHLNNAGTGGNWTILTAIPTGITGQQAQYQWPATFSGASGNFAFINSDLAGTTATQNAYFTYQTNIDLSAYGNTSLYLTFSEYYRNFNDKTSVEVSVDGGTTWTIFEANPESEVPVNTNCVAGEVETVNITSAKGANPWTNQVRVRFHYVGAYDWFWGVDNVKIVEAWDNDIKLNTWFQATDTATTQGLDYYHLPASQVSFPGLTFGAKVKNNGSLNQAAVSLIATATGGYNQTGTPIAINANFTDSLSVTTPYIPTGIGTKTVNITTGITGTDSDSTNNQATFDMFVTQYEYSRDNNIPSGSIGQIDSQNGLALKIGNVMEIFDNTAITAVKLRLATQAAGAVDAVFFAQIMKYNFTANQWDFLVETEQAYVASTAATWVNLPILDGPLNVVAGDVLLVLAAHEGGTDEVRFGLAQNTFEGTVLGYTATNTLFQLTDPQAVMIRLLDDPAASVAELSNEFGMNVYPNPTNTNTTVSFDLNNEATAAVNVTDLSGKVVFSATLGTVNGSQNVTIETQSLTSGVYMVNLSVDGAVSTQKLVVKN
jgi:hypothetical protein